MLDSARLQGLGDRCSTAIEEVIERARRTGRRHYFALRRPIGRRDPLADFLASPSGDAFYWQEPSRDIALLGLGRVETIEANGRDRFARVSARASEIFEAMEQFSLAADPEVGGAFGPLLVGGFGFYDREVDAESDWQGLGSGRLLLPETTIVCRGRDSWATRTVAIDPDADPRATLATLCEEPVFEPASGTSGPRPEALHLDLGPAFGTLACGPEIRVQADRSHGCYMAQVQAALEAIEAGKVEKVVVARSLAVTADEDFDLEAFLGTLREIYPSCATVAVREGEHLFACATPERLVALEGDAVRTAAVAGSAPRGRSREEEARFSSELLTSKKEREEHEVVKRSIRVALRDVCGELEAPSAPTLLKLEGIQHLETLLSGRLNGAASGRTSVLDLVGRLHPTPAVGGAPSAAALDWLERFEGLDRGWYAGPIGYLDRAGDGEFRVALRSALLRGRNARLFAGAGIVAGSDPERELAETRLKLRALLAPLTEI